MRALSIQQPWAWAILHAGKRVENRKWMTGYRGPVAIHASRGRDRLGDFGPGEPPPSEMAFGAIVGLAQLADCVRLDAIDTLPPAQRDWLRAHPFTEGPCCLVLKDVRPLPEPIPCSGMMGLWDVPTDLLAMIDRMLAEERS